MQYTTLISADDLALHIEDKKWIVVDCRHDLTNPETGRKAYEAGHIPHAEFAHLDTDLSDKRPDDQGEFRGRHPLPAPEAFIKTLRRWGIDNDSQIIAYDAQAGMFAARLWWMLRWLGHRAVAVLDGGIQAWQGHGMPLLLERTNRIPGTLEQRASLAPTVTAEDILANISSRKKTIIDARAPDRFRGENELLDPVGGHIPGAKNRFFKDNLQANGLFKGAEQLHLEFNAIIPDPQHSIMQCGSGVTACHHVLAMEIAGLSGAALYPGSWSEWCANPSRPVVKGMG